MNNNKYINTVQGIASDCLRLDQTYNDINSFERLSKDDQKIITDILNRSQIGFDICELFVNGELDVLSIKGIDFLSHLPAKKR